MAACIFLFLQSATHHQSREVTPNVMACRRRRQRSLPGHNERHIPNNVDQLAFKYMEMCKVESSSDSDSEISPRWSDTSTMGWTSTAPEHGTLRRALPLKPTAKHCYSAFLDPYDGSSEDSDESDIDVGVSRRTRQQGQGGGGGCWFFGRSRRFIPHHPASVALREVPKNGMRDPGTEQHNFLDVQMKCGSDSELWVCELHTHTEMANDSTMQTQAMDIESQLYDSGLNGTRSSTPQTPGPLTSAGGSSSWFLDSSSERSPSPCTLRSLYKRKLGLPGAEVVELGHRKRQCVVNMEDKEEAGDSAFE